MFVGREDQDRGGGHHPLCILHPPFSNSEATKLSFRRSTDRWARLGTGGQREGRERGVPGRQGWAGRRPRASQEKEALAFLM